MTVHRFTVPLSRSIRFKHETNGPYLLTCLPRWLAPLSPLLYTTYLASTHFIPDGPGRWNRHWLPKRRILNFRRRGNYQKNTDCILNTAKVLKTPHVYIDIHWLWIWNQCFYLGIWNNDRTKIIVLSSFQLATQINSQNRNETEFINVLWHINFLYEYWYFQLA